MATLAERPIELSSLKRKCEKNIESVVPSSINWNNLVGQGTYGLILGTIIEPDKWVVKIADKTTSCTAMNHEIKLHERAIQALMDFKSYNGNIPIFCPLVANYAYKESCCWYYMQKIFKPTGFSKLVHTTIEDANPDEPKETREKWSGIYPSPVHLKDIINKFTSKSQSDFDSIYTVANFNGIIFGILHYISKQTAQDLEIVLGKLSKTDKIKVFFYDFDKSSFWEKISEDEYMTHNGKISKKNFIKLLSTSLGSDYCTTIGDIGKKFIEGYLTVASITGFDEIANSVIKQIHDLEEMLQEGGRRNMKGNKKKSNTLNKMPRKTKSQKKLFKRKSVRKNNKKQKRSRSI